MSCLVLLFDENEWNVAQADETSVVSRFDASLARRKAGIGELTTMVNDSAAGLRRRERGVKN